MEYGVFISENRELPTDLRLVCSAKWQTLLPPAPLRAIYFGSEFCEDLLPDVASVERFCLRSHRAGVEAVLLTPVVTPKGLSLVERLLRALAARGHAPAIVCNDWGVLSLLRRSYPGFSRRAGRLMNRGLRDPRMPEMSGTQETGTRERIGRMRSMLVRLGVEAVETDSDLDGSYLGEKMDGMQRTLHFPYVFAATGRNCLVKADGAASPDHCFTKGLGRSCTGLCRGRQHLVQRGDSERSLWRSGNTVFYEASSELAQAHMARADRIVLYERPTP